MAIYYLDILSKSLKLIDCTIYVSPDDRSWNGGVFELPQLQRLTFLKSCQSQEIDALLNCLSTPSLRHFTVDGDLAMLAAPFSVDPFLAFLARSNCEWQSPKLRSADVPPAGLIRCLRAMPSVRSFHVGGSSIDPMVSDEVLLAMQKMTPSCLCWRTSRSSRARVNTRSPAWLTS